MADSDCDLLFAYWRLYAIYLDSTGMVEELKPLFRLPGIYMNSITLSDEVRRTVQDGAARWLRENPA